MVPKTLGKYEILDPLGRGGMGEVHKAFQPDLHRHVAIKTMLAGEHATEEFLQRFQREARTAARLVHPNIVQIHDIGVEGKLHYIVMEFVEGWPLKQLMAEKKLDLEKSLRIAYTIARALEFAHGQKIIHRDIKPANVLIDKQGRVRILDFGLAKSLADGKGVTASGSMLGTVHYMAPEQAFGAPDEVDARADLYSLGAMLHEMVTGRPPFDGATVLAVLRKIEEDDPPPAGVSAEVDALIQKALAKDREKRFQTAAEMAEALKRCLGPAKVDVPATGAPVRGTAGWRSWIPAGAILGALAIAGGAWALWPPKDAPLVANEVREILEQAGFKGLTAHQVDGYRKDPGLRAIVARGFLSRGQYSRAAADLEAYERGIAEIASAGTLQRFVCPGLFRVWIKEPEGLKGAQAFLAAAFSRHQENRQDAAREKLHAAEAAGAPPSHVMLVRAHLDLWDIFPDPAGETEKPLLQALRRDLEPFQEPYLLALKAVAAHLDGDAKAAWDAANLLRSRAPLAAETYLLRSILFQREGRIDLAQQALGDAAEQDRGHVDQKFHGFYLRLVEVLNDPEGEKLDPARMRVDLDERLRNEHYPAALFLRAILNVLDSQWNKAEDDLKKLARRTSVERIVGLHDRLAPFAGVASEPRSRLLEAARDLQWHLGRPEAALRTAGEITGVGLSEEERVAMLLANHRWQAVALRDEPARALAQIEQALKLGAKPQEIREDEGLGDLRNSPAFQELLRRFE